MLTPYDINKYRDSNSNEEVNQEYINMVRNTLINNNLSTINFDRNIKELRVSKSNDERVPGHYNKSRNKLVYKDKSSYIHELFHVSSSDKDKDSSIGIRLKDGDKYLMIGLDEGITDYLTVLSGNKPSDYGLLRLCAELIVLTNGINVLDSYLENDGKKFRSLFPYRFMQVIMMLDNYYYSLEKLADYRGSFYSQEYFTILDNIEKYLKNSLSLIEKYFTTDEFDCKIYISDKINAGYLKKEFSILGIESIDELYPKEL